MRLYKIILRHLLIIFSPQAPFFPQNPNNHDNQQFASNSNNQTNQNNDNSTLKNVGKYVAAAAVDAVASSMLHSASTASAAPHIILIQVLFLTSMHQLILRIQSIKQ